MAREPIQVLLARRIREQGPIPFQAFMETCLYHPEQGYYARPDFTTGRQGDFATAPDAGPLFGATLARLVERFAQAPGRLVELGPGSGRLVADVLAHLPASLHEQLEVVLVDPFEQHHQRLEAVLEAHQGPHRLVTDLDQLEPGRTLLVANEVLDALPVHPLRRTAEGWETLHVDLDERGLVQAWAPAPSEAAALADRQANALPPGSRYEANTGAQDLLSRVARVLDPGVALLFDYGGRFRDVWPDRPEGTLRGFREHRVVDPLTAPGSTDLTFDVDFTHLQRVAREVDMGVAAYGGQERLLVHLGLVQVAQRMDRLSSLRQLVVPGGFAARFQALVLDRGDLAPALDLAVDLEDPALWTRALEQVGPGLF